MRTAPLYISPHGFSACPQCARHVELEDDVVTTCCPACGASITTEPRSTPAASTWSDVPLPGRAGRTRAALRAAAPVPPVLRAQPRDPALAGDTGLLPRTPSLEEQVKPHPIYVVWELTLRCDLACGHCGSRAGRARSDELTTAECLDVVAQLARAGVREVTLIGGEAYLRPDWTEIAGAIVARGMTCTMTSGGRGLDAERVKAAAAAGVSSIAISIDGLEHTHDAQRGVRGSWRAAIEASERVASSSMRLTTNTQLNALSSPEVPAIGHLMAGLGSAAWQLQLTVAMGRAADRPGLLLQPHQLLELFPLLVWTRENILDPAGIALVPGNNVGYFGPFEELIRYGAGLGAHWSACSAGRWTLGIEADGTIKGCPSLPTRAYAGGNLRTTPLETLLRESPALTTLGQRTRSDLWGFCRGCRYGDVCLGGCSWTSHCLLGAPGNNPYCIHRALELDTRGIHEQVEKIEAAPGEPFDAGRFVIREVAAAHPAGPVTELIGRPIEAITAARASSGSLWSSSELARMMGTGLPLVP